MPKSSSRPALSHARAPAAALVALAVLAGTLSVSPAQAMRRAREDRVRSVLKAAWSARGTPYRYGGTSPQSGFDCSGFTRWAWAHGGDNLPHSSSAQYDYVRWHVRPPRLQPGDLLFFYRPISHVAIFIGRNRMIEAPNSGGRVRVSRIYWQSFSAAARPP